MVFTLPYLFHLTAITECRIFVTDAFFSIPECYLFGVTPKHCRILSNVFMKNYTILCTPRSNKEFSLKVLKLSNT